MCRDSFRLGQQKKIISKKSLNLRDKVSLRQRKMLRSALLLFVVVVAGTVEANTNSTAPKIVCYYESGSFLKEGEHYGG